MRLRGGTAIADSTKIGHEPDGQHQQADQNEEIARMNAGGEVGEPGKDQHENRQRELDGAVERKANALDHSEGRAREEAEDDEYRRENVGERRLAAGESGDRGSDREQNGDEVIDSHV